MNWLKRLLTDPPPGWVFELSPAAVAVARTNGDGTVQMRDLPAEALSVTPQADNVAQPERLLEAIRELAPPQGDDRKRRRAALILPDFSVRVTVLSFESFPSAAAEQANLVRHRLRRSVPFDVESALLDYAAQPRADRKGVEVVTALAPYEVVGRYEEPFRQCGFHPGHVTISLLATLPLLPASGLALLAKLSGGVLTLALVEEGNLRLARTLPLGDVSVQEVLDQIFPTLAYSEDHLGRRPDQLWLCGFGMGSDAMAEHYASELALPVSVVRARSGHRLEQHNAGIYGYMAGVQ